MINAKNTRSAADRFARAAAVTVVLTLGTTACSGDSPSASEETTSSTAPDANKASAALDAGLKAHTEGDLAAATEAYSTVLKYDATNKFAFYNLALIDESEGNYGLAEDKYRSALEADADYEPALFNLAILRTGNDPREAISLYKEAVAADKKDAAAWLNLGLLLRANGKEREGDKDVLRAIALNPDLVDPGSAAQARPAR
jgi:tetratricopeptide (TPR) repeat protein